MSHDAQVFLELTISPGAHIPDAIKQMVAIADNLNTQVRAEANGRVIVVDPGTTVTEVLETLDRIAARTAEAKRAFNASSG